MSWRAYVGPVVLVLVSFVIGSWLGAAVALAAVGAVRLGQAPRRFLVVSLACVVLAMLSWVIGTIDTTGISFTLVTAHPWPNRFALAAVVLLMVGVFSEPTRETRG